MASMTTASVIDEESRRQKSSSKYRRHDNARAMEMRCMSLPEDESGFSEILVDQAIRKVNSVGNKYDVRNTDTRTRERGRSNLPSSDPARARLPSHDVSSARTRPTFGYRSQNNIYKQQDDFGKDGHVGYTGDTRHLSLDDGEYQIASRHKSFSNGEYTNNKRHASSNKNKNTNNSRQSSASNRHSSVSKHESRKQKHSDRGRPQSRSSLERNSDKRAPNGKTKTRHESDSSYKSVNSRRGSHSKNNSKDTTKQFSAENDGKSYSYFTSTASTISSRKTDDDIKPMPRSRTCCCGYCSKKRIALFLLMALFFVIVASITVAYFVGFFKHLKDPPKTASEEPCAGECTSISNPRESSTSFPGRTTSTSSGSTNDGHSLRRGNKEQLQTGSGNSNRSQTTGSRNTPEQTTTGSTSTRWPQNTRRRNTNKAHATASGDTDGQVTTGNIEQLKASTNAPTSGSGTSGGQLKAGPSQINSESSLTVGPHSKPNDALTTFSPASDDHLLFGMDLTTPFEALAGGQAPENETMVTPDAPHSDLSVVIKEDDISGNVTITCTFTTTTAIQLLGIELYKAEPGVEVASFRLSETRDDVYCRELALIGHRVTSCLENRKWLAKPEMVVRTNVGRPSCHLAGRYTCTADLEHGTTLSASEQVNFIQAPSAPVLAIPEDLVDGRESRDPVTCSADVGFPPGHIEWHVKRKGEASFRKFSGFSSQTEGECGQLVTTFFHFIPTLEANGTLVRCALVSPNLTPPTQLTTARELQILPGNLCTSTAEGDTIAHPFTCFKYIECTDGQYIIHECSNNRCFDQANRVCGKKSLSMTSVVAYLNEGVTSLKCHLSHAGHWQTITISKVRPGGELMDVLSVSRQSGVMLHDSSMNERVFAHADVTKPYEVDVNFWIYVLTCEDEGAYQCRTDEDLRLETAVGTVQLLARPGAPSLFIPSDLVEGARPSHPFSCTADVGYPHGELNILVRLANETDFRLAPYNITEEREQSNCSAVVRKTFRFVPGLEHNEMRVRCEVNSLLTLPTGFSLVAEREIHVLPGNFCQVHSNDTAHVHPYDCHQYVQCTKSVIYVQACGGELCFNPASQMCDMPPKQKTHVFDAYHPCAPDQNGVYFEHPVLCNKFVWCVQGHEVVQHCPLGTLYLGDGQCTFEPALSSCYFNKSLASAASIPG